jgi:hypothetical protein
MGDIDDFLANLGSAAENFDAVEDTLPTFIKKEPIRVPRIPYSSITSEEFERQYSATNTPIILGDAFEPAGPVPHFDVNYFKQNCGDALVP